MNERELKQLANLLTGNTKEKSISIEVAFNNFIENAKLRCRIDTINYYQKNYKVLNNSLATIGIIYTSDISKINYRSLETILKGKGYSNCSINKYTDILKMIFKYNFDMEQIDYNPLQGIKKLPQEQPTIKIVNELNIDKILKYLFNLDDTPINNRNVCFMLILKDTGIRLNELLNIKQKNVDIENNSIFLEFTKTHKHRNATFSNLTKGYLKKWIINKPVENEYLFISFQSLLKMEKVSVYTFLNKLKRDLNITQSITPHKWRHTLATTLLEKNLNIEQVREVLGHEDLTTTKKYLHNDKDKLKNDLLKVL